MPHTNFVQCLLLWYFDSSVLLTMTDCPHGMVYPTVSLMNLLLACILIFQRVFWKFILRIYSAWHAFSSFAAVFLPRIMCTYFADSSFNTRSRKVITEYQWWWCENPCAFTTKSPSSFISRVKVTPFVWLFVQRHFEIISLMRIVFIALCKLRVVFTNRRAFFVSFLHISFLHENTWCLADHARPFGALSAEFCVCFAWLSASFCRSP